MITFFGLNSGAKAQSPELLKVLQQVRGYWEALRRGPFLPHRADIDPRGLSGTLEHVFLIERIAKGHARFRLSGMHLNDLLGMDVRGMPLSSCFEPLARTRLSNELEQVFDATSIIEVWLEGERSLGRPALTGRMLLLPLESDVDGQKLALGCLISHGVVGRQPRRFAISGLVRELIVEARPVAVNKSDASEIGSLSLVASSTDLNAVVPPRRRPALRLVSSREEH